MIYYLEMEQTKCQLCFEHIRHKVKNTRMRLIIRNQRNQLKNATFVLFKYLQLVWLCLAFVSQILSRMYLFQTCFVSVLFEPNYI